MECAQSSIGIESFTKIDHAAAINNKQPDESVKAMKEISNEIGIPRAGPRRSRRRSASPIIV